MKKLLWLPVVATLLGLTTAGKKAAAAYRGAARYACCPKPACEPSGEYACAKQQCYTAYRTCREVVYEKQQYTCTKTVYETVCDEEEVTCYKNVAETCYRDVCKVTCVPVCETKKIMVDCGEWKTETIECPGPVVTKCVQEPG